MNETGASANQNNDWRTEFTDEMRRKIVNKLFIEFKSRLNDTDQNSLTKYYHISMQYERNAFHSMTSKEDYINKIRLQLKRFATPSVASKTATANSVEQGGSSMQNMPGRQPVEYQSSQQQTLQNQPPKQIVQQPNSSPLIDQSEIFRSQLYKPQQQIVSEPPQYQHFQQAAIKSQPGKQSSEQHLNNTIIVQQNHKFMQQRNASEQQKPSNSLQQPLVLKGNVFVTPQKVNLGVCKSNAQNFQQQQNHGSSKKSFLPTEVMQEGFQHFPSPHQAQGLADQQKLRNSIQALPEASTAQVSTSSTETVELANWHHQAYQELQSLRTKCLPSIKLLFQKFEKNKLESKSEIPDRHKREMSQLARMINFLRASPSDIARISKDVFDYHKRTIIHTDNTIRNSIATRQRAQLQPPQPQTSSQHQKGNMNVHFQSVNLASRSTPDGPSPRSIEHPEALTQGIQIKKEPMEMQNTIEDVNPRMLQQQHLTPQHVECPVEFKPSVASQLSSPTCRPQSTKASTLVDAQTKFQSITTQPIDHLCAVASNLNPSVASQLSSATCPQSSVSSTLVDGQPEHQSPTVQPIDRLCAVVQTISPEALLSSVEDIFSVVNMVDIFSGTTIDNDPRAALGEDLAYATRCRLDAQYLNNSAKHDITPHAFDALIPSVNECEPIGSSGNKRQKTEAKYDLLYDIKRINHQLIETVVDMESSEVDLKTEVVEAKVVKCSYVPMAARKAYKSNISSEVFPELKLRVVVPADYPNASPIVLDSLTTESTNDKSKEFTEKAKFKLGISVCLLSEPFSLEEIARTWDQCCRAVFCEFAHTQGGGSLSSRFGSWEVCSI